MSKITLVLDNLRSCQNVGSILRTCDGLGVSSVVCIGTSPYPRVKDDERLPHMADRQTKQIAKSSLGAETTVKVLYYPSIDDYLAAYHNVNRVALEQTDSSVGLSSYKLTADIHLVVGNEVNGVSKKLLDESAHYVEISMQGKKESLNVAVATGIALHQLLL